MSRSESPPQKKGISPVATLIGWVISVCMLLLMSLVISILVEWLGMFTFWKGEGSQHAQGMYRSELAYVDENLRNFAWANEARMHVAGTIRGVDGFWEGVSEQYGLSQSNSYQLVRGNPYVPDIQVPGGMLEAAYFVIKTFTLRLYVITFTLPLFTLALLFAFGDGWVERELRKYGGDSESNVIFDYTSRLSTWVVGFGCVVYLAMPFSIDPVFCILPTFILFTSLTRTAIKKYKKRV